MHEPPARSFRIGINKVLMQEFQHWHYSTLPSDWRSVPNEADCPQIYLPQDRRKFVSPILFVDSHVAFHDFTANIRADPDYDFEPTKDWVWYKRPRSLCLSIERVSGAVRRPRPTDWKSAIACGFLVRYY